MHIVSDSLIYRPVKINFEMWSQVIVPNLSNSCSPSVYKTTLFSPKITLTRSSATAKIVRDADFSVDDVHIALTLAFNSFNSIIQGHSMSSVVVPIDAAYMIFY